MTLTDGEIKRYSRQTMIFGEEGQEKLKNSKVFIAGAGGLGSPISIYLAVAGVGNITIVDHDIVELSNLNRQILHGDVDINQKKTESAKETLTNLNSDINVNIISDTITDANVKELVGDADLIIGAMDNFETRHTLNKASFELNIPYFHGAVSGFDGQATTIIPGKTACLNCIFPKSPLKAVFPIIGVTPGFIGIIQATEVFKYITGQGKLLENEILLWNGLNTSVEKVKTNKRPDCEVCGKKLN
ncbi:HesA/MoeB/ThiF family protein [Methanobacterium petrolearium]|uniref:HesA/MoeB/ThiF family protein n=1 Tax=Methanobacterium petrolearium TaxID=710190 RepID=UPI001AE6FC1C|nr:HesA/MoeB/ThiF family protein [Methanobacterium petrolearium]MBP1945282.1 adenylyltransferase/sulfurtransferase [Methanobacterium petrolearium]BDZ71233.1 adenylyltransferase [Methanobacterium petrolearium]